MPGRLCWLILHQSPTAVHFYRLTRQSLELVRALGDTMGTALALSNLAEAALNLGDYVAALYYARGVFSPATMTSLLPIAAIVLAREGRQERAPAIRSITARLRSTSSSVVAHDETLIRMAVCPCQIVPPHQHVPSAWIAPITRLVVSASPNDTSTWLSTTSFSTW